MEKKKSKFMLAYEELVKQKVVFPKGQEIKYFKKNKEKF